MFEKLLSIVLQPAFMVFEPQSPFCWFFLLCAAGVALFACWRRRRQSGAVSLAVVLREVFDPAIFFHRSAIVDYKFVFLTHLLSAAQIGAATISAQAIAHGGAAALAQLLGQPQLRVPGLMAAAMMTLTSFIAMDAGNFYFHLLQHRSPFLWELHKVHHSAEVLTPLTALRVHPVVSILGSQLLAICAGLPASFYLYYYGHPVAELQVAGVNLLLFLWHTVLVNNLAHSHVWVMYPKGIREVFYSPALHLIHHSSNPRHYGKNFGFALTVWDRLAGTLYWPAGSDRSGLVLGLDGDDMRELRTTGQLFWTPLRNIMFGRPKPATTAL